MAAGMETPATMPAMSARAPARWVHGPVLDVAMALCWVPFVIAGLVLQDDGDRLSWFVSATLLLSFSHQPLTVALVYGDRRNFSLRRRIFTWSPLVFAIAVLATREVSLATLAVVAGLWNAEHTLMQRYGITRIYGRKAGQQDGGLEKLMLFSWLALAFVWAAADARTPGRIEHTGIRGNNRRGLDILADLRPAARVLLPFVIAIAAVLTVRWLRYELRRGGRSNPAKHFYVAATASLFVVILVNPIAGFLGYVGSHAVEYFIIVHQSIGPRYASVEGDGGAPVGKAVRRLSRPGFFVVYLGLIVGLVTLLDRYGSLTVHALVIFTLGGMHVFYDGFIWKRPAPGKGGMLTTAA
ncbi:MAG TPA: hypothetical protein VGQ20_01065 [Acidimicrobiales bacterium]|jgi:hypothetical protein|nr:hypothetical protein [Acidimicrobiales bacterium]